MKKFLAVIIIFLILASAIGVIYYTFKGYFMIKVVGDSYYDGLGRKLYDPPIWIKMIWPGFQFPGYNAFFMDLIGFWVYVLICVGLKNLISLLLKEKNDSTTIKNP